MKILKKVKQPVEVDIDLPYYYKHDLMLDEMDSIIYGKIEEEKVTRISVTQGPPSMTRVELEVERSSPQYSAAYIAEEEYASSQEEFAKALEQLQAAVLAVYS